MAVRRLIAVLLPEPVATHALHRLLLHLLQGDGRRGTSTEAPCCRLTVNRMPREGVAGKSGTRNFSGTWRTGKRYSEPAARPKSRRKARTAGQPASKV